MRNVTRRQSPSPSPPLPLAGHGECNVPPVTSLPSSNYLTLQNGEELVTKPDTEGGYLSKKDQGKIRQIFGNLYLVLNIYFGFIYKSISLLTNAAEEVTYKRRSDVITYMLHTLDLKVHQGTGIGLKYNCYDLWNVFHYLVGQINAILAYVVLA